MLAENGKGYRYPGGRGGHGLNARVSDVRIMTPTPPRGPSPGYPGGYVSYGNASGQIVHQQTGLPVARNDPCLEHTSETVSAVAMEKTKQQPFTAIVGEQLSAVEFVQDYVQLRFGGPYLTAITHPTIKTGKTQLVWEDQGYCDQLCKRIGKRVRMASVEEHKEICLEFDDGVSVCISLEPDDYCGAEAAIFDGGQGGWWVW